MFLDTFYMGRSRKKQGHFFNLNQGRPSKSDSKGRKREGSTEYLINLPPLVTYRRGCFRFLGITSRLRPKFCQTDGGFTWATNFNGRIIAELKPRLARRVLDRTGQLSMVVMGEVLHPIVSRINWCRRMVNMLIARTPALVGPSSGTITHPDVFSF